MIVTVDASVIVKWFFPDPVREPHSDIALSVLRDIRDGRLTLLQPPHWLAEVTAVVTRLEPSLAETAIELLAAMELPTSGEPGIYREASRIATKLKQHVFDTLYHAVALQHGGMLVSADRRYYNLARQLGGIVHLVDWKGAASGR